MATAHPRDNFRFYVDTPVLPSAQWDEEEEVVVFHANSGDTHLLTRDGFSLLQLLQDNPLTMQEILEKLQLVEVSDDRVDMCDQLERHYLLPFYKLGLIQYTDK